MSGVAAFFSALAIVFATGFFAGGFLAAPFLATGFFAGAFFAGVFFAFFAAAFFTAGFFAVEGFFFPEGDAFFAAGFAGALPGLRADTVVGFFFKLFFFNALAMIRLSAFAPITLKGNDLSAFERLAVIPHGTLDVNFADCYTARMTRRWAWMWAVMVAAAGCGSGPQIPVFRRVPPGTAVLGSRETPDHPPRRVTTGGYSLSETEITVAQYAVYLRATDAEPTAGHPAFRRGGGGVQPARGWACRPMTDLRRAEAEAYARWLGDRLGARVRLPTEDEWEVAARGGLHGARWPWGWGPPDRRARYQASGSRRVGRYPANPWGLRDMAGNVFEWCAGEGPRPGTLPARGGAWSERDPAQLRVFHRAAFPPDYAGPDVGFRVLMEE
jgi:hypothetical protein